MSEPEGALRATSDHDGELPAHLLRGQRTRERVLSVALPIATEEGLEALTIGRVAEFAGITKAGLLGHFSSKEALQIATLDAGKAAFIVAVIRPGVGAEAGIVRVARLLDRWIDHICNCRGGCFFASVAAEFDGHQGGSVKDHIAKLMREWIGGLEFFLGEARERHQLRADTDLSALSFRLHGYELSLNLRRQLLGDMHATRQALQAMRAALLAHATPSGRRLLEAHWEERS